MWAHFLKLGQGSGMLNNWAQAHQRQIELGPSGLKKLGSFHLYSDPFQGFLSSISLPKHRRIYDHPLADASPDSITDIKIRMFFEEGEPKIGRFSPRGNFQLLSLSLSLPPFPPPLPPRCYRTNRYGVRTSFISGVSFVRPSRYVLGYSASVCLDVLKDIAEDFYRESKSWKEVKKERIGRWKNESK